LLARCRPREEFRHSRGDGPLIGTSKAIAPQPSNIWVRPSRTPLIIVFRGRFGE
jgi:hypothetical protein